MVCRLCKLHAYHALGIALGLKPQPCAALPAQPPTCTPQPAACAIPNHHFQELHRQCMCACVCNVMLCLCVCGWASKAGCWLANESSAGSGRHKEYTQCRVQLAGQERQVAVREATQWPGRKAEGSAGPGSAHADTRPRAPHILCTAATTFSGCTMVAASSS